VDIRNRRIHDPETDDAYLSFVPVIHLLGSIAFLYHLPELAEKRSSLKMKSDSSTALPMNSIPRWQPSSWPTRPCRTRRSLAVRKLMPLTEVVQRQQIDEDPHQPGAGDHNHEQDISAERGIFFSIIYSMRSC